MAYNSKPSIHFCETGSLEPGEVFNQDIHNLGETPEARCSKYYPEYNPETTPERIGGKSRKHRRKSKKSRKPRRKSKKSRKSRRK
ncbi:MAG: hypothetical protein EBY20_02770 [Alphaproteobacteria bacterium]|jgi:hypothetical protein|uniref:Uncharacterized protein n=1 Tax=viral metagenome TaxID=1070528 RepID=A0A6C0HP82_9ZZZZ|nr:hypothetical protein [Alphaproteobacteria bacterium]NDE18945.1 hypothetical protein [Alphaproteobacteria bacterium]